MQPDVDVLLQCEERRYRAMLDANVDELGSLLDDDLRYVHSDGVVQTKTQYLRAFAGERRYTSIDRTNASVVVRGEVGLVHSDVHIQAALKGGTRNVKVNTLAVWVRSSGAWRLLALHSAQGGIDNSRSLAGITG